MDYQRFKTQRDSILSLPLIYRDFAPNEIITLDETHVQIGNATLELQPKVFRQLDAQLGIKREQSSMAQSAFGTAGVTNLRNFFAQAYKSGKRIALVADTHSREISDIKTIKESVITPQAFFDFADLFMNDNDYEPTSLTHNRNSGIAICMQPKNPVYLEFTKGDGFLSNGLCLQWNPGEIRLDNYFERLVCSNGQIVKERYKIARAFSADPHQLDIILKLGRDKSFIERNTARFIDKARKAMACQASVRELGVASRRLLHEHIDEKDVEQIIPYRQNTERYERAGYSINNSTMSLAKSDITFWTLFNILTAFATHNTLWGENDLRRTALMGYSMDFLFCERDIKEYYNIY